MFHMSLSMDQRTKEEAEEGWRKNKQTNHYGIEERLWIDQKGEKGKLTLSCAKVEVGESNFSLADTKHLSYRPHLS